MPEIVGLFAVLRATFEKSITVEIITPKPLSAAQLTKVTEALERAQAAKPAMGCDLETKLMMQGVQAGSAAMLETVLDWIDEIAAEGK